MQELGGGLVYWDKLAPIFEAGVDLVAVLELEPQTLWEKCITPEGPKYRVNDFLLDKVCNFPQTKIAHGVAHPIGGTTPDPIEHLSIWRQTLDRLNPRWVSEHLSFNRSTVIDTVEELGFLLPPRQTASGVKQAVNNLAHLRNSLGRPCAFETGVNYFKPRPDELSDGEFFGSIATNAECGILLDLHNLWVNEKNGRQKVQDALKHIPLDQVWEVHLAGGMKLKNFWLDAHSDGVPEEVMTLAEEVIPQLPNLGALIFEILPEHLPRLNLDGVCRQLEALQKLWELRLRSPKKFSVSPATSGDFRSIDRHLAQSEIEELAQWESAIANLIRQKAVNGKFSDLADDPGTDILKQLVTEFRSSSITRTLRYSLLLLLLSCGSDQVRRLIQSYCHTYPADMYPSIEGERFAGFLRNQQALLEHIPYLKEILAFELALIKAATFGLTTEINWSVDPTQLFDKLDAGLLPKSLEKQASRMTVESTH